VQRVGAAQPGPQRLVSRDLLGKRGQSGGLTTKFTRRARETSIFTIRVAARSRATSCSAILAHVRWRVLGPIAHYDFSRDSTAASKVLYTAIIPLYPSLISELENSRILYLPVPLMPACIIAFRMVTPLRHHLSSSSVGRSSIFISTRTES
jgi:hypothetical protein